MLRGCEVKMSDEPGELCACPGRAWLGAIIIAARLPLETIFLAVGLEIKKCTKEELVGPGIQLGGWCDGGGGGS